MDVKVDSGDEEMALLSWAKPVLDLLNEARGSLSELNTVEARETLLSVTDCLKVSFLTQSARVGIGGFKIKPADRKNIEELPVEVLDVIGIDAVLNQCVLGFTKVLDGITGKVRGGFDSVESRLHMLSDLWNSGSIIATPKVREAAEKGFLIVARRWLEDAFAKERPFLSGGGCCIVPESERLELFNRRLGQAIEISKRWVGPVEHIETCTTTPVSIGRVRPIFGAETRPKGEPEVTELTHRLCSLAEEIRCTRGALPAKDGLTVDAPAFEKRPVPKPETPNGRTPTLIKR